LVFCIKSFTVCPSIALIGVSLIKSSISLKGIVPSCFAIKFLTISGFINSGFVSNSIFVSSLKSLALSHFLLSAFW